MGGKGLLRALLVLALTGTLGLPAGAGAQVAPTARPQGGKVSAGTASITQSASTTTVTVSSQHAVINWTTFDVGAQHTVMVQAPSGDAVVLMRVTGPDPSVWAGRVTSNGTVVLTNPSGETIEQGGQVNTHGLVLAAAGVTNRNFMAGRLVFDRLPEPDAGVSNAGSVTAQPGGTIGLVAPRLANSGALTAPRGAALLLAGQTATLNLSFPASSQVTKQDAAVPTGANGQPVSSLVAQTGTITARGGLIRLAASAADGILTNLVSARGRVAAPTAGTHPGAVGIAAVGGSVSVPGRVQAVGGRTAHGGTVQLQATHAVTLGPKAVLSVAGGAGGGTLAVGTTVARAAAGPGSGIPVGTSRRVVLPAGSALIAGATASGDGGRIAVLSTERTNFAGRAAARGGPNGGNGGAIEFASGGPIARKGTTDVSAPDGQPGTVTFSPRVSAP